MQMFSHGRTRRKFMQKKLSPPKNFPCSFFSLLASWAFIFNVCTQWNCMFSTCNTSIVMYLKQLNCIAFWHTVLLFPIFYLCLLSRGSNAWLHANWVAKRFSRAVTIGGEGWAATPLVNKTPLKRTHHNYCLYYPSRSRTEAPTCNWLTNCPICARPIEIIVLVRCTDMLTESYQSLWLKQSIPRCSQTNILLFEIID